MSLRRKRPEWPGLVEWSYATSTRYRAVFQLECPLVDRDFTVWALPPRLAPYDYWYDWRVGMRLGENASGAWSQRVAKLS